jgi:hypothetical protein
MSVQQKRKYDSEFREIQCYCQRSLVAQFLKFLKLLKAWKFKMPFSIGGVGNFREMPELPFPVMGKQLLLQIKNAFVILKRN